MLVVAKRQVMTVSSLQETVETPQVLCADEVEEMSAVTQRQVPLVLPCTPRTSW